MEEPRELKTNQEEMRKAKLWTNEDWTSHHAYFSRTNDSDQGAGHVWADPPPYFTQTSQSDKMQTRATAMLQSVQHAQTSQINHISSTNSGLTRCMRTRSKSSIQDFDPYLDINRVLKQARIARRERERLAMEANNDNVNGEKPPRNKELNLEFPNADMGKRFLEVNKQIDGVYQELDGKITSLAAHVKTIDVQLAQFASSSKGPIGILPGKSESNPKYFWNVGLSGEKKALGVHQRRSGMSQQEQNERDVEELAMLLGFSILDEVDKLVETKRLSHKSKEKETLKVNKEEASVQEPTPHVEYIVKKNEFPKEVIPKKKKVDEALTYTPRNTNL
ncbi:unnamed protein product [Arabis nemorensis]|uniref:Uncharacterized protein n=1 Tax=Arabis nemorensis TaxID=586526 RepID=A0A565BJV4_9BRAS|nr:unnamed protein product [Arabis nemorensis]